ncbi:mitochondrial fission protein ELM1-like [Telopea speciosissima]|uniref:mitochondrial fission protein ELM1-like n=1 Tax=Telopea speciosissima TaxID=54955 RepID=UPI001CC581E9|nr:mitochondrial fission protein ELM1-like [Telopea speciosissima]
MRAIRLPEPPSGSIGMPEIFEGGIYSVIRRAVIIGNGFAGSENQSFGLVRALGLSDRQSFYRVTRPRGGINEWLLWLPVSLHKKLDYIIKRICGDSRFLIARARKLVPLAAENGGISGFSTVLEADAKQIATIARESFEKDGPLLVVASGHDTIALASSIKRLAPENVFVVQIQHPRLHLNRFDLVITPQHDYYPLTPQAQEQIPRFLRRWITPREPPDRHAVLTVGALHQADFAALRSAATTWHDELAPLPKPLLVVNVGGPMSHCRYGVDLARQLTSSIQNVLASCGSLRISFSRRTPQKVANILIKELSSHPKVYIWDGEGPNPHMGHLAWADAFVITADSVSMLSEACSTGKPVYVIGAERCNWKFSDFQKSLRERGVVRPFTGKEDISESWSYPPLNDTAEAASRVREALAERGWRL